MSSPLYEEEYSGKDWGRRVRTALVTGARGDGCLLESAAVSILQNKTNKIGVRGQLTISRAVQNSCKYHASSQGSDCRTISRVFHFLKDRTGGHAAAVASQTYSVPSCVLKDYREKSP